MFLLSEITCDICGAMHSKSGKPFDNASLARHIATVHPPELHTHPASALICDICGVNQSATGKRFTRPSQVWQHKKKRHANANDHSMPLAQSIPLVGSAQEIPIDRHDQETSATKTTNVSQVKFCPCCGFHLAVVHSAMDSIPET